MEAYSKAVFAKIGNICSNAILQYGAKDHCSTTALVNAIIPFPLVTEPNKHQKICWKIQSNLPEALNQCFNRRSNLRKAINWPL